MAEPEVNAAGGLPALRYVLDKARGTGRPLEVLARVRSGNTCKTCALGMGGDLGGMVNEVGHFPEVCKKSVQAQAGDMAPPIPEEFFARTDISDLERLTSREAERLGRLAFPIAIGPGDRTFRRISWSVALQAAGDALKSTTPDRSFFYLSGRSSNEAAFLTQLVARAFGTNNVHNCSYYCHNASSVALAQVYGSGTSSVDLTDLSRTDLAVVIGANPASNHPRLITQLIRLRERGGRVIVINPLSELGLRRFRLPSDARSLVAGSTVSDLYVQPRVGGDVHLLTAVLKRLIELDGLDHDFIQRHTRNWDAALDHVRRTPWEDLLTGCGLTRSDIDRCADLIAGAESGILMWAMGLTHHAHGTDNILALANLALARGWLGRPGAGLLPIRGHSNVQGVGSMGVSPLLKKEFTTRLEHLYGIDPRKPPGQDTYASMTAAHAGDIDACVLLGGNLWGSNPDSGWATQALRQIPFSLSITTKLNPGHFRGRGQAAIIVPALTRDEEAEPTTQESMFNYVRFSCGGTPMVAGEMRSEVDIIAGLAERILPPDRFEWSALRSHEALRRAISQVVPGYQDIHRPGLRRSQRREFSVAGRVQHSPEFPTRDGRAQFHAVSLPDVTADPDQLILMTVRSEGQFNTVVYDDEDLYRGNTARDVVMISAADAQRWGVVEGDRVLVSSSCGSMSASVAITGISVGSAAMYYPEANVLVPQVLDPQSHTPAFKSVPVRLTRA